VGYFGAVREEHGFIKDIYTRPVDPNKLQYYLHEHWAVSSMFDEQKKRELLNKLPENFVRKIEPISVTDISS